jgi:hypothetical protein
MQVRYFKNEAEAIQWVHQSTDNVVFVQYNGPAVRVDQNGYVYLLTHNASRNCYFWEAMRRLEG